MKKYFILLTLFFISYSSLTFGNTLLLKCTSLKFFDDDWVGNILFVKIDEEKSRVYLNEPANKTTGWTMNKLTSVKSDFFTFENCENIKCENSQFAYHTIDRVIGSLKYYSKTRKNEKYITMYEYQCEKMDKKF